MTNLSSSVSTALRIKAFVSTVAPSALAGIILLSLPLAVACGAADSGDHVGESNAAISLGAPPSGPLNCSASNLTPGQISACLALIAVQVPQQPYCDGKDGGEVYECNDFTNSYCAGAQANDIACAGEQIACQNGDGGGDGGTGGHAVAIVEIGGKCYFVEPQIDNGGPVQITPPWLPENGSCNTFPPQYADEVCAEVGFDAGATCAQIHHDGNVPHSGVITDCEPILRDASVSQTVPAAP